MTVRFDSAQTMYLQDFLYVIVMDKGGGRVDGIIYGTPHTLILVWACNLRECVWVPRVSSCAGFGKSNQHKMCSI